MNNENSGVTSTSNDEKQVQPPAADEAKSAFTASVVRGAHRVADGVKEAGESTAQEAKKTVEGRIAGSKERAANGLGSVAAALRQTGEQLQGEEGGGFTEYVTKAADGLERASGYLKERELAGVLSDAGNFARREPALFLGGAFIVGLAGGRFLKSSHRDAPNGSASGNANGTTTSPATPRGPRSDPHRRAPGEE